MMLLQTDTFAVNLYDTFDFDRGCRTRSEIRSLAIREAVVGRSQFGLSLPKSLLVVLGLDYLETQSLITATGIVDVRVYSPVRLHIQGRDFPADVAELPADGPVIIAQFMLNATDFVIDPVACRIIGNPPHGGERILDLFNVMHGTE